MAAASRKSSRKRLGRADREASLLEAAAKIVAGQGVEALSMEGLAASGGVNKAIVYRFFANRDEVLLALWERETSAFDARVQDAVAGWSRWRSCARATACRPKVSEGGATMMGNWTESEVGSQAGRRVLVTGANRGIGWEAARVLAARGARVQLGVNHLGPFALTGLLLPRLLATHGSRIVTVSSNAHRFGRIRFDDLQWESGYRPWARSRGLVEHEARQPEPGRPAQHPAHRLAPPDRTLPAAERGDGRAADAPGGRASRRRGRRLLRPRRPRRAGRTPRPGRLEPRVEGRGRGPG